MARAWRSVRAEGEGVVGVHGGQGDVGPVVVELWVDLGDAGDAPAVFVVPGGARERRILRARRPSRGSPAVAVALSRRRCGGDECLVGAVDVVSSAAAEPVQGAELGSLTFTNGEALRGPLVFLGGVVGLSAGGVELCAVVGRSGGDDGGVFVAFGAQCPVEGPGVVVGGEGLGLGAAHAVGDDSAGVRWSASRDWGWSGSGRVFQVWVGWRPRDWPT